MGRRPLRAVWRPAQAAIALHTHWAAADEPNFLLAGPRLRPARVRARARVSGVAPRVSVCLRAYAPVWMLFSLQGILVREASCCAPIHNISDVPRLCAPQFGYLYTFHPKQCSKPEIEGLVSRNLQAIRVGLGPARLALSIAPKPPRRPEQAWLAWHGARQTRGAHERILTWGCDSG